MPCYHPLQAWRGKVGSSGKRSVVFKRSESAPSIVSSELKLPCGQCIGCRLERSRQWAMRCVHEASLYKDNCFLTLTYSPLNMPLDGSLVPRDYVCFMKRLRRFAARPGIRFFHCGEYGEKFSRPHYHSCIFNYDFSDKVLWKETEQGHRLYRSESLERLWPLGHSVIGDVSFDSAAYVARYVLKKVTGKLAADHYADKSTGVLREPEYVTMSRGCKSLGTGGIGKAWYDKYKTDIYPDDYAVVRGMKVRPPKFYDGLYEGDNPDDFKRIKCDRVRNANRLVGGFNDSDSIRLGVKEEVKLSCLKLLSRPLEVYNAD